MRITPSTLLNNLTASIHATEKSMDQLQQQIGTGRRLTALSDDPTSAMRALWFRSTLLEADRYKRNNEKAQSSLEALEGALEQATGVFMRAKEIAVVGASGTQSAATREAFAKEVGELLDHLISVGNTFDGERFIFAGTKNVEKPFVPVGQPPGSVTYGGNAKSIVFDIGPGDSVQVNASGDEVFGGTTGPFANLVRLRDDLAANRPADISSTRLKEIDASLDGLISRRSEIGARLNRVEASVTGLNSYIHRLTVALDREEGVDVMEAVTRLKVLEQSHQITLQATARIVRPTLLDFLS
jgi:flagellar hook-associated protein 3 FlgL